MALSMLGGNTFYTWRREEEQWGSGAVGQWGREEEQIGAIKGCEYPSIGQSDEQRYGGKGTGLYQ
jgi:hypothetical protein